MRLNRLQQSLRDGFQRALAVSALASLLTFAMSALPPVASGDVYRKIEPDGTLSFTNVPTDPRYKKIRLEANVVRVRLPEQYLDRTIARQSRRHRIDPALLRAVIKVESNYNPAAVSKAGAIGLMQLMPDTAVKLNVRDPYDPEENISGGARYLRHLLDRFRGNLPLALAAYNAGERRVEQYQALPPIHETRRYVYKVLRYYDAFLFGKYAQPARATTSTFRFIPSQNRPRPVAFAVAPSR